MITSRRAWGVVAGAVLTAGMVAGVGGTAAAGTAGAVVQTVAVETATVYLVQGLPGQTVDVAVDGTPLAQDLQTTQVAGPFTVEAGTRTLTFTDDDGAVLASNTVDAQAGSNSDLVLHLTTAAGTPPVVTRFPNDLTGVPVDKASVTVAHTAAVPPADIRVDGQVLFANVANGESLHLVVPAGSYSVDIVPAGENAPVVFGPVNLAVQGGSLTRVYAVGDPSAATMNVAVHVIAVPATGSAQPTLIDTGSAGFAGWLQLAARILNLWRG